MRIFSDTLDHLAIRHAWQDACAEVSDVNMDSDIVTYYGRRRAMTHEVALEGHGAHHTRRRNTGKYGRRNTFAATWMDWGWFIAVMFRYEPTAVIGQYDGREQFLDYTQRMIAHKLRVDASVKNFAVRYNSWWPNPHGRPWLKERPESETTSPFTLVDRVCPPEHLVVLHPAETLEAWLTA